MQGSEMRAIVCNEYGPPDTQTVTTYFRYYCSRFALSVSGLYNIRTVTGQ